MSHDEDKRIAAEAAVAEVADGMLVGLGTGSTAAFAIRALTGRPITCVATSEASGVLARSCGLLVVDFARVARVDLTIDGADEIDTACRAIKGAGGAMLREKIVAAASARMVVVADGTKRVASLGAAAVPVEVLPFAAHFVGAALHDLFEHVELREGLTDNGNVILDGRDARGRDWPALAEAIAAIPGALGHGLFLEEVDAAYIADHGVVTRLERGGATS